MSSKRKKINTFSASDICQKLSSRRPKRSHSAGKASSSRDHSVQSNSELETVSDGHIVSSAITTAALALNSNPTVTASTANSDKTVIAEGYKCIVAWFRSLMYKKRFYFVLLGHVSSKKKSNSKFIIELFVWLNTF